MNVRALPVVLLLLAACKPAGDAAPPDAGAAVSRPTTSLTAPQLAASAPSAPATAAADPYLEDVAETKRSLALLTARGEEDKAKIAKLPAAKQKAAEAAVAAYEKKHAAVTTALAKLPAAEPSAAKAEAASDAMMGLIESLKGALDTLDGVAGVY